MTQLVKNKILLLFLFIVAINFLILAVSSGEVLFSVEQEEERFELLEREVHHKFGGGEKITLRVTYMGLTAGYIEISTVETTFEERPVYRLELEAYSSGAASWMYSVRDTLVSYMDIRGLFSWGYDYHQKHNGEQETERVRYQQDEGFVIRDGEKDGEIPPFTQDVLSTVYYLRGRNLQVDQEFSFPVHYEDEVFHLILKVEKLEKIITEEGWQEAFKLAFRLGDDEREEELTEKLKDSEPGIRVWISNDERRLPLQIQIPAYFGSLYGYFSNYEPGDKKID